MLDRDRMVTHLLNVSGFKVGEDRRIALRGALNWLRTDDLVQRHKQVFGEMDLHNLPSETPNPLAK